MATKRNFIKQFFKDRQMVGAISPSSRSLGEKMLTNVDFKKDKLLVELGPGTGVFTDLILEKMAEDARLLVFELNETFYQSLSTRIIDPRVQIIHDSAEFIEKYLKENEKVDAIISSLPLMIFPTKLRNDVVKESYDCLKENGTFIQFQYSLQSKRLLASKFNDISINFTIKNFPPAFIYTCRKQ